MQTDLEVEVEADLRPLGKVIIFRDTHTDRTFLLYIDDHGGFDSHNVELQVESMIACLRSKSSFDVALAAAVKS